MSTSRTWHKGPPPHVGWWLANTYRSDELWCWWNGRHWSGFANDSMTASEAVEAARIGIQFPCDGLIEWSDYWPENARVPRVDPAVTINHEIVTAAQNLIAMADSYGMNVTIARAPRKPLAAGNTEPVIEVWQKRRMA